MIRLPRNLPFWLLLLVILLSPYYRGIYPDYYKLPFVSVVFLAFFVFLMIQFRQKEKYFLFTFPELLFLCFILIYLFSIFTAASKSSAFISFLCYTAWAFLFWMILRVFQKNSFKVILIQCLVWNAAILSFLGFFGALNLIPQKFQNVFGMSLWGLFFSGRLATTFQYQNTSASFFAASLFMGVFLLVQEKLMWKKVMYGFLVYGIFSGFLFGFSRGANLAFLIILPCLFIFLRRKVNMLPASLVFLALFLPFLFFQVQLDRYLVGVFPIHFWVLYGIGLSFFLFFISVFFRPNGGVITSLIQKNNSYFILLMSIIAIECLFTFYLQFDLENFSFVRSFEEKGRDISLETKNVVYRLTFYKDAIKMIQAKPFLGWGGGGWAARYFSFQSFTYYTKFPHSFYLNTMVESGLVGVIFLLLLLLFAFRSFLSQIGKDSSPLMLSYLGTSVLFIFFHSSIDLNFAMGAYHIFTWTLFALLLSFLSFSRLTLRVPLIILLVPTIFLVIVSIFVGNAEYSYQLGMKLQANRDLASSARVLETAVRFNPFHDNAYYQLGLLSQEMYSRSRREEFLNIAQDKNAQALDIEPNNYEYHRQKGDLLLMRGEFEEAWSEYSLSMELAPMVLGNYEKILFSFLKMIHALQQDMINTNHRLEPQIQRYTDIVYNQYLMNQSESIQPAPPSEAMDQLKNDIVRALGGEREEEVQ